MVLDITKLWQKHFPVELLSYFMIFHNHISCFIRICIIICLTSRKSAQMFSQQSYYISFLYRAHHYRFDFRKLIKKWITLRKNNIKNIHKMHCKTWPWFETYWNLSNCFLFMEHNFKDFMGTWLTSMPIVLQTIKFNYLPILFYL